MKCGLSKLSISIFWSKWTNKMNWLLNYSKWWFKRMLQSFVLNVWQTYTCLCLYALYGGTSVISWFLCWKVGSPCSWDKYGSLLIWEWHLCYSLCKAYVTRLNVESCSCIFSSALFQLMHTYFYVERKINTFGFFTIGIMWLLQGMLAYIKVWSLRTYYCWHLTLT